MSNNDQNNNNNKKLLNLAIKQIENYVTTVKPQSYKDIKNATDQISKAAISAHLSVHSVKETLEFINDIAHTMVEDENSVNKFINAQYLSSIH